jgi:membrane fusion protein (multidrug efflux system)
MLRTAKFARTEHAPRRWRSTWLAAGLSSALARGVSACSRSTGDNENGYGGTPEVGVVTMAYHEAQLSAELPGRTSPFATSDVRPQVSGILQARLFEEGSLVKKNQPLYQIDPAPYQAALDSARAALANAEAVLATARLKANRYAALADQNAIARQDYDDAEAAFKQAAAAVQQQKAVVESARINLGYTRIIAPIGGRIGRSSFTQGALVTADQSQPLATIQTLDPIYVDINQSTSELIGLKTQLAHGALTAAVQDAPATLLLEDGTPYLPQGKLEFSEVTVDPNTGAVVLRAIFPNPDGLLLPGMYVRARIVEGTERHAILAPQRGVSRNEKGEPTAFVVDSRGIARLRVLKTSQAVGDSWLVTTGLAPGDKLIVEGLQKVAPDMPVRAVPAESDMGAARAARPS